MEVVAAGVIFLVTYALIATERVDKTVAALLGGSLVVVIGIVDQEAAFAAIDLNVIFLLVGMMILAGILRRTGFFQWVAIRSVKVARGEPYRLLLVLSILTAVLSAFLDNVTTVVLIAPVTLYIAGVLGVSPIPYLISEILASNIGGAATLIGDPPNILIGSAAGLGFGEFLANMAPVAFIVFIVFLGLTSLVLRRRHAGRPGRARRSPGPGRARGPDRSAAAAPQPDGDRPDDARLPARPAARPGTGSHRADGRGRLDAPGAERIPRPPCTRSSGPPSSSSWACSCSSRRSSMLGSWAPWQIGCSK
ncbi:MAG: SLC13 family permease [Candidatus Limnocylindrales bacterium]